MAVLLITHDLNLVRRFADRVAVMENGHLVEQGTVGDRLRCAAAPLHPQADRQPPRARRGPGRRRPAPRR
jgi:microcin C transport system ATP-binding protein